MFFLSCLREWYEGQCPKYSVIMWWHSNSGVGVNLGDNEISDNLRSSRSELMQAVHSGQVCVTGCARYSLVNVVKQCPQ